jgi:transposase
MKFYAGIDLHSNNNHVVVIDEQDQVVHRRKLSNEAGPVLETLRPFAKQLEGVVVESTYNWYWLVDSLQEVGYRVHLANTAAIQSYAGQKQTNDWSDAQWLAHLLRLGLLREGYIYPKEQRGVRDLLRKRMQLVRQRTLQILSFQSAVSRHTGGKVSRWHLKVMLSCELEQLYGEHPWLLKGLEASWRIIQALDEEIERLEKEINHTLRESPSFKLLKSVWGIGPVLAWTIVLETGPISRFASAGDYCSYCRVVPSERQSNGKKKGENNRKCGNKYLSWAYSEAAQYASRYYSQAHAFVERKTAQGGRYLGWRALASKLCRASYYVLRDEVEFDPIRLFGSARRSEREKQTLGLAAS